MRALEKVVPEIDVCSMVRSGKFSEPCYRRFGILTSYTTLDSLYRRLVHRVPSNTKSFILQMGLIPLVLNSIDTSWHSIADVKVLNSFTLTFSILNCVIFAVTSDVARHVVTNYMEFDTGKRAGFGYRN